MLAVKAPSELVGILFCLKYIKERLFADLMSNMQILFRQLKVSLFQIQNLQQMSWTEFAIEFVPALRVFWDLEKTVLHETRVSGTVLWSPTNANSPTYTYISQKTC